MRCFFAALIAFALMLNGMGVAASAGRLAPGAGFVEIAGIAVTLCQYAGADGGKGAPLILHDCDRCALCAAPWLAADAPDGAIERPVRAMALRPAPMRARPGPSRWRASWPRGPPAA
ncbi:hypothetical protein [Labrys monachus]|uniref:Uncharacterized protein n=1 Tax=Labrys monachus TaxID=217067 RepID=A0ABU0FKI2_9HYPH|nr:hypothetical protein [Labrys monachus]MDQ0395126.1 hypothetical protein [Labrys monachus]